MNETSRPDPRVNAYRPDLADMTLQGTVKAERYVEPQLRQCARGLVPLLAGPDINAVRVSEIRYGEFLDVFEERNEGFAWVQNRSDRYVGYMPSQGTFSDNIAALSNRVGVLRTFVYPRPDFKSSPIDILTLGSYVGLAAMHGPYLELANGGFVFAPHVAPAEDTINHDYVFTAGRLLHVPYLWGGRSPDGIDCSGLVQLALEFAGIDSPRDSDQQRDAFGKSLPCHWRDAAWGRGDLVFFQHRDGFSHVGIMTNSEMIIHATSMTMSVVVWPLADLVAAGYEIIAAGRP